MRTTIRRWAVALGIALALATAPAVPGTTGFYQTPDNASTTTTGYTAGAGSIALATGGGAQFGTPTSGNPVLISTFLADGTPKWIGAVTGRTTDTLTGLTIVSGSDASLPSGAQVRVRWTNAHVGQYRTAINALETTVATYGDVVTHAASEFAAAMHVHAAGDITSGTLAVARGGTGQATAAAAYDALSPTTTKGDLPIRGASGNVRLPVGTDGQVLTADSAQSAGAKWATLNGIGSRVLVASANGCALDTSLTSGGGTDDTAALQALLDRAQTLASLVVIVDGPARTTGALYVWSNTWVIFTEGAGLFFSANAGNNGAAAIRNKHPVSSYNNNSPVYDGSTIVDHDIAIVGPYINGNRAGGASGSADARGNAAGSYVFGVFMSGVKNLTLERVEVQDPCAYGVHLTNVFHAGLRDIKVTDPQAAAKPGPGRNTDAVHGTGPLDDIRLVGLTASSCDDALALNARDGNLSPDVPYESGQAVYGGFATAYKGPITNVSASHIVSPMSLSILRWLSDSSARVDGISVSDVRGVAYFHAIAGVAFGTADYGRIDLSRWQVSLDASAGDHYAHLQGNHDFVRFASHVQLVKSASFRPGSIYVDGSTTNQLVVEDCHVEQQVAGGEEPLVEVADGPAVKLLRIAGCSYRRAGGLSASTVASHFRTSGTGGFTEVTEMTFTGNTGVNVPYLIDVAGNTVGSITMAGTHHSGAGGNSTVRVTNITVPRLVASGSNTADLTTLVGTGAITTKRTDGTEDAP